MTGAALGAGGAAGAAGVLVVGYGNSLRGDDGIGWHAAGLLADDPRLSGTAVLRRHQLTPELALDVASASLVVFVDASVGAEPGAITIRRVDEPPLGSTASSHHLEAASLLALAHELYGAAPAAFVVSVGAATLEVGAGLSPAVAVALPGVVDAVAGIVAGHGRA